MLFNSLEFCLFLPIVFFLYWFGAGQSRIRQNILILAASYFFYAWWDWRFLSLILISTGVDYFVGLGLEKQESRKARKILIGVSLAVNLGILGFFKYYNFFIENFVNAFGFLGFEPGSGALRIILPVGISFYTFRTLSYTLDVYKGKLKPTRDFIAYAAFVSFFPQLVAGPIERAANLLPQLQKARTFDYSSAVDGLRQILWGLFKKLVVAENCALIVDMIFGKPSGYNGSALALGAFFYTIQIYADFSGYSDMALGIARLFGLELMKNFAFPYFSRDIAEFWRRWHISLSSWFRDYLYIPLGGNRGGPWRKIRNVFIVFTICGVWHGANWTFIVWGALHGAFFFPRILLDKGRKRSDIVAQGKLLPTAGEIISMSVTFVLVALAWVFFRSANLSQAVEIFSGIFSASLFAAPNLPDAGQALTTGVFIVLFTAVEWLGRDREYAIQGLSGLRSRRAAVSSYYVIVLVTLIFGVFSPNPYIYFQF